ALPLAAVTLVLGSLGFTGSEIAASSTAAKMISPGAMANGGGECLGGLVATLQSVGSAALSLSSKFLLGTAGPIFGTPSSPPPAGPDAKEDRPRENVPQVEPRKPVLKSDERDA
uniref:Interferon alpha inducible protein 27 like 2 n=1 Tax=Microcebus murinus TaxID=30608 RepID=A0A8C5XU31_MICMU